MLGAFAQAFRTPDLRRKLLYTLFIMAAFRLGSFIPTPGVDSQAVQRCMAQESQASLLDLVNLFSGGALLQLSIFALGIMPYITASIIIQLLRVVIPRFDDLHKEGQTGQAKLTQYTRYLTIFLGILQATTTISLARSGQLFQSCNQDIIKDRSVLTFIMMIIVMMAGTGVIMWLVEQAQRRIPVQYAKRMIGRRQYGGTTTYIPLKINMSGVIPVIFASSILALPPMAAQFGKADDKWVQWISAHFTQGSSFYLTIYALMTLFFTFFYTAITFNPDEVADNMKKYGGFIPGYRAGRPTAEYLRYVINRITSAGALYLVIIALLPSLAIIPLKLSSSQMPFGGTTLLIIIGVGLQTVKEINTQLQQHHYEGFLK